MALWVPAQKSDGHLRSSPKNKHCIVHSDRVKQTDRVFLFPWHSEFVSFFAQKSLKSQGDSFIVSRHLPCQTESHVPVSPFSLPGTWCCWKAAAFCGKQQLSCRRFRCHPPPEGTGAVPGAVPAALPHRDAPEEEPHFHSCLVRAPLLPESKGVPSGIVIREKNHL